MSPLPLVGALDKIFGAGASAGEPLPPFEDLRSNLVMKALSDRMQASSYADELLRLMTLRDREAQQTDDRALQRRAFEDYIASIGNTTTKTTAFANAVNNFNNVYMERLLKSANDLASVLESRAPALSALYQAQTQAPPMQQQPQQLNDAQFETMVNTLIEAMYRRNRRQ